MSATAARDRGGRMLALETSDPAVGPAFERVARILSPTAASTTARHTVASALAAVMVGDRAPARALLERLAILEGDESADSGLSHLPLLAARYLAWTGDAALAARVWPRVRDTQARATLSAREGRLDADDAFFAAHVTREIVPLAEVVGDRAAAAELGSEARALLRDVAAARPSDRIATVAATLGWSDADSPAALHRLDPGAGINMLPDRILYAWAGIAMGDAAAAETWREALHGIDPRGTDRIGLDGGLAAEAAAHIIGGAVAGLIGAVPDAPRLRLRLRPRLPPFWRRLAVRDLPMGDARCDVDVSLMADRLTCVVEQTAGAYPATLILEIPVPEADIRLIEVDARPASLDIRRHGAGYLVPVQLVLDDRRTVVVERTGE